MPQGCVPKETSSAPFHTGTHVHTIWPKTVPNQDDTQQKISRIHSAASRLHCRVCAITWCIASVKSRMIRLNSFETSLEGRAIFANLLLLRLLNRWHPHSGNEFLYEGLNPPLNQRTSCSSLFCACCHFDRPQYDYEQIDRKPCLWLILLLPWFIFMLCGNIYFHTHICWMEGPLTFSTHLGNLSSPQEAWKFNINFEKVTVLGKLSFYFFNKKVALFSWSSLTNLYHTQALKFNC
jgi:hypothetical protein